MQEGTFGEQYKKVVLLKRATQEKYHTSHTAGSIMFMHTHTNRLINETSAYLLQHAHNPVNWYPWGEEALNKARDEDKPILVSIGYAACHWCHVMERESFEDETAAAIMNEHFINIKIDREERPDLDHVYMDAVQAMAGSGGWPLNVFLMPDGKPFYGGTYFPPQRAFNRPSWKEMLMTVHTAYTERKHELQLQSQQLTAHLIKANSFGEKPLGASFNTDDLQQMVSLILQQADAVDGGFGAAPKFPQTFTIQFLLRHYYYTRHEESLKQALLSLDKMIYGGIYDQLGGGFARYSTDAAWLAPHFEKMLYDNALLITTMAEAYQLTQQPLYKTTIHHTIGFMVRELMNEACGFFSSLDADSEGVEGKFYTWNQHEINAILGEDATLFSQYYDVSEHGNWEHTNILRVKLPASEFAAMQGISVETLNTVIENGSRKLMAAREKRVRPLLDDKILLGWNALANIALSKAYGATLHGDYLDMAVANMRFLEEKLFANGQWYHSYAAGQAKIPAFLDDLAYLASAYIHLQEITGDAAYLVKAKELVETIICDYSDEALMMFYFTRHSQSDIIVRKKEIYDGATPSGNAVMCFVLGSLAKIFDKPEWEERAAGMLLSLKKVINSYPTSFGYWAQQVQTMVYGLNEIAVVGPKAGEMLVALLSGYIPARVLQSATKSNNDFPLLTRGQHSDTLIFLCKNYVCRAPFTGADEMLKALSAMHWPGS